MLDLTIKLISGIGLALVGAVKGRMHLEKIKPN